MKYEKFVGMVCEKANLSEEKVDEVLMFAAKFISSTVKGGGSVKINKFGTFSAKDSDGKKVCVFSQSKNF